MVDLEKANISFNLSVEGILKSEVTAAYIDIGTGPVILFIHGFFSDAAIWTSIISNLSNEYRCISLDLLGFGDSSRLEIEYKVDSQVAFTKQFMKALGIDKFFVVGHSLGSWTASRLEIVNSESILGLILLSPAGVDEYLEGYRILIPFSWKTPVIDWLISLASPFIKLFGHGKLMQEIIFIRKCFFHDPVFQAWIKRAFRLEISDELINEVVKNIDSPTLIIGGELDEMIPLTHCEHLESNIPDATLQVIPDGDHSLPSNHPELISELTTNFVKSIES